jgi:hypothetical protein
MPTLELLKDYSLIAFIMLHIIFMLVYNVYKQLKLFQYLTEYALRREGLWGT